MNTLDLDPTRRLAASRSDTRWSDPDLFELINPMQHDSFVANVSPMLTRILQKATAQTELPQWHRASPLLPRLNLSWLLFLASGY